MRRLILILALLVPASVADAGEFALGPSGQEQMLESAYLQPDAGWSAASYDSTNCVQVAYGANYGAWSDDIACSSEAAAIVYAKGVWLTRMSVVVNNALLATSTGSCTFRLTTSDGATAISGSEFTVGPGSGNTMDAGTIYTSTFNYRLPAGTDVQLEAKNGDQCGAGAACVCETMGDQTFTLWGRF
jgi:hypothetical protein